MQGIGVATKLVYLNLSYNNISQIPNEALAECTNLQHLVGIPVLLDC